MLRELNMEENRLKLTHYVEDFRKRFIGLLSYEFKTMDVALVVEILEPNVTTK